eukprot:COSAG01_NODE_425_length_17240_cov_29.899306_24_plen_87_part_00
MELISKGDAAVDGLTACHTTNNHHSSYQNATTRVGACGNLVGSRITLRSIWGRPAARQHAPSPVFVGSPVCANKSCTSLKKVHPLK